MKLEALGYNRIKDGIEGTQYPEGFALGRVMVVHKDRYLLGTEKGEMEAEITGKMRFSAESSEDFPAVGDWVAFLSFDPDLAIIHEVLPRFSTIRRQAVGSYGESQIIGANIDCAFIMQSADRDFNMNRLERYLTICYASGVEPVILLTKTDLVGAEELSQIRARVKQRMDSVAVVAISNETQEGYDALKALIEKGKTYCLLGSSGVGKSTLLNNLTGKAVMKTDHISSSTGKGRHVSSHRELTLLPDGGILIDNPGMREVGIVDDESGLDTTFDRIMELSQGCRFRDCTHTGEEGCAVLEALAGGDLDESYYQNYQKLVREKSHFESSVAERRKKDKEFGKMVKQMKKDRDLK
jgi:ribosome biogenesis GTPase